MTEQLATTHEALYRPTGDELVALACQIGSLEPGGTLRPLVGGCHTDVYAYETPKGTLVIRSPKHSDNLSDLRAEYDLLLELDGLRAPRAIGLGEIKGTPVMLVEHIPGEHKKDFNALAPEEIEELARAMADFHTETSQCYSGNSGAKPACAGTHADYLWAMAQESVADRLLAFGGDFSDFPGAPQVFEAGIQRLEGLLLAHPGDFSGTTFVRLHHDLNPGNVMWKPDGTVVFIDANPTYGDACDDVNYVVSNNGGSPKFQRDLLAAYASAAPGADISAVRMAAYTLKNGLDDLAWTIEMCEKYRQNPALYEMYKTAHTARRQALETLLGKSDAQLLEV